MRFFVAGRGTHFNQNNGCPRRAIIMSKTKSKKKNNGSSKVKPKDVKEVPVDGEAEDEMSAGEKFLLASKPYWAHIALGVLAVIFASVLWTSIKQMGVESDSQPWRDLNNAMTQSGLTNDVSSLKEMATNNEGKAAAHWALLLAGDNEVNRGIDMLARDRVGGLKLIEQGVESLQKVVDAPVTSKTPMVQRRSLFRLASAREALGEFDVAKGHYQQILEDAPDSPFAPASQRGLARCSSDDMIAIYDSFRNWEATTETAPGPLVPDAPKLNIDGIKLPEGESDTFSGGDFGGNSMKKDESADEKAEMSDAMKAKESTEKSPAMEMKKEEPVAETESKVEAASGVKPEVEVPKAEMPKVEVPKAEMPDVEVPKAEMPEVEVPKAEMPEVEVPKAEMPEVEVPEVEVPKVEMPKEVPGAEVPKVELPKEVPAEVPSGGTPVVEPAEIPVVEPAEIPAVEPVTGEGG